jgi:hypothetical protein
LFGVLAQLFQHAQRTLRERFFELLHDGTVLQKFTRDVKRQVVRVVEFRLHTRLFG